MSERPQLTRRQRHVLGAIVAHVRSHGHPPTVRELTASLGLNAPSSIATHMANLAKKGYLAPGDGRARAYRVLDGPRQASAPVTVTVPVLGRVAAGLPLLAEEQVEGWLHLDASTLRPGREYFALTVRGDSMIDASILPGDILLVERRDDAEPNQIVVALLEDEATVKRFVPHSQGVWLEPANPAYSKIRWQPGDGRALRLLGVVVGLQRDLLAVA